MPAAFIIDTETSGLQDPEIIELAWEKFETPEDSVPIQSYVARYRNTRPISPAAKAVHHIVEDDLTHLEPWSSDERPQADYIIGHNVDFDADILGYTAAKRICTLAISRLLWPKVESHSLSTLCYYLDGDWAREYLVKAHSAAADVYACRRLLTQILETTELTTWEDLWTLSEDARVPRIVPFGKHKGIPIEDLPRDYVHWCYRQPDMDPYFIKALDRWFTRF